MLFDNTFHEVNACNNAMPTKRKKEFAPRIELQNSQTKNVLRDRTKTEGEV